VEDKYHRMQTNNRPKS